MVPPHSSMARSRLDISMSHHQEPAHDHYLRSRTEQRMVDDEASRKKYALLELYPQEWRREQDSPIRLDKLYRRSCKCQMT